MNAPTPSSDSGSTSEAFPGQRHVAPTLAWCAVTATAHALGATWLASPVLGLPAGLWLIGMGVGTPSALRAARSASRRRAAPRRAPAGWVSTARRWPEWPPARALADVLTSGLSRAMDLAWRAGMPGVAGLAALHDRLPWPARPVRIALAVGESAASALAGAPGVVECEVVRQQADPGRWSDPAEEGRFDAVVREGPAGLEVGTPEALGHEASWYDWSDERPLSYAGVFPMRVDCARLSLAGLSMRSDRDAGLARALIETAAVLSRSQHRLTAADRVLGRRPIDEERDGSTAAEGVRGVREPAEACLKDLAFRVQSFDVDRRPTPAERAAARVVSAWLSTRPLSADEEADIAARRRGIESAALVAGDEPEVMLRLAAVRFASMDDDAGYDALWRADRILRDRQTLPGSDQFLFLQAEIDMGPYGPMTLGRAAAGICLLCATTPVERIPYVRDDLIDDMRYSGWLVGRDQDRAMLMEVFRRLERIRRSERMGLPSAAAA